MNAFNDAFASLNALGSTHKSEAGRGLTGIATTTLDETSLGELHNYTTTYIGQDSLAQLVAKHPQVTYEVRLPSPWTELAGTLLPILIIGVLLYFFFAQMQRANNQQMGFGKAKAKKAVEERPDVKFSDVAGVDEAVEEMQEIKDFLANPSKYQSLGARIPRGCLLVGASGHRQDASGSRGCGRGRCAVLQHLGFRLRRDVRGRGRFPRARSLRAGQGSSAFHHFHRRDRRRRSSARCRLGRRSRRARANLEPVAG